MAKISAKIVLDGLCADPIYECHDVVITIGETSFSVVELLAKVASAVSKGTKEHKR